MNDIVYVRLRMYGAILPFLTDGKMTNVGDYVIVEAERGVDYGQVTISEPNSHLDEKRQSLKKIIRKADYKDIRQIQDNKLKSKRAFETCSKKITEHKLKMKLIVAEYSFDRSKIIFYFTADGRIDFRSLVKDLARIFKARIELRQIGVRDEAKFYGGYGPCGRKLCCATFLKDFEPVTIKMAKEQNLPLNPPKISGLCGRLMCCLIYEYINYKELTKGLPKEGESINTEQGKGKVSGVNILKRLVNVELEDGRQITLNYNK